MLALFGTGFNVYRGLSSASTGHIGNISPEAFQFTLQLGSQLSECTANLLYRRRHPTTGQGHTLRGPHQERASMGYSTDQRCSTDQWCGTDQRCSSAIARGQHVSRGCYWRNRRFSNPLPSISRLPRLTSATAVILPYIHTPERET